MFVILILLWKISLKLSNFFQNQFPCSQEVKIFASTQFLSHMPGTAQRAFIMKTRLFLSALLKENAVHVEHTQSVLKFSFLKESNLKLSTQLTFLIFLVFIWYSRFHLVIQGIRFKFYQVFKLVQIDQRIFCSNT